MDSESIAHKAEGRMCYWLWGHGDDRNSCFSKIQLVGQKDIETKYLLLVEAGLQTITNMVGAFATSGL